jgi:hypothetical protein
LNENFLLCGKSLRRERYQDSLPLGEGIMDFSFKQLNNYIKEKSNGTIFGSAWKKFT